MLRRQNKFKKTAGKLASEYLVKQNKNTTVKKLCEHSSHHQRSKKWTPFQVVLLLYVCQFLVALLWRFKLDPDNAAIPYMTALGDLLGTGFLYLAFLFARSMHEV